MSEKKRTTVTTIETHEVWIIRRVMPDPQDEPETINLVQIKPPDAAMSPPSSEFDGASETSEEQE
jgi:hypothetical protein